MVSLPSVRFACSRNAGRPLVKAAIHCSFASTLQLLELSVISIMSPISHCSAVQIFTNTSVVTFSFFPSFAIDPFSVDGESHFYISDPENVVVDIEKLAEWFQQIRDSLDGLYYMYSDEWENA